MEIKLTDEVTYFIKALGIKTDTKVKKRLTLLREYGHMLRMPYSKHILPGIFELRVIGKNNVRLIYTFRNGEAIVFHAYTKKTEEISTYELNVIKQKFNNNLIF